MTPDIVVLLSLGRHPQSGRARTAVADARALAFALAHGGRLRAVHAGTADAPGLQDYLGLTVAGRSLDELIVLDVPAGRDIRPALVEYLRSDPASIVLAGPRAEVGEGSGMLAYDLAAALGRPIVPAVADLQVGDRGDCELIQVLPRGRRRRLSVTGPLVATVDGASAIRPIFAHARARRGVIRARTPAIIGPSVEPTEVRAARPRPKRLHTGAGGDAAARLRAASETQAGQGRLLIDPAAEDAAVAIRDYLRGEGFLGSR